MRSLVQVNGRVTFAAGVALGCLALVAVRAGVDCSSGGLSICTYAVSSLAGLFLGIILSSSAKRRQRRDAAAKRADRTRQSRQIAPSA